MYSNPCAIEGVRPVSLLPLLNHTITSTNKSDSRPLWAVARVPPPSLSSLIFLTFYLVRSLLRKDRGAGRVNIQGYSREFQNFCTPLCGSRFTPPVRPKCDIYLVAIATQGLCAQCISTS